MKRTLIIEDFGKIKKAEIDISPLTLFVGDNNSGKSYLLSLIWGIYAAEDESDVFRGMLEMLKDDYAETYKQMCDFLINTNEGFDQEIKISSQFFVEFLNKLFKRNKDKFVAGIFNSEQMTIGKLAVVAEPEFEVTIEGQKIEKRVSIFCKEGSLGISFYGRRVKEELEIMVEIIVRNILLWFLKENVGLYSQNTVYLPAARTGFMLAKNVINKVGRQVAYDVSGFQDREEIQPFTKPIIHFLDMLEGLSLEHKTEYGEIVKWMETSMAHGRIQYGNEMNGQEIRYLPDGSKESLPLRTTSAVVTELTPLLLLLKYRRSLQAICYEEPEMCLHPRLQQEMGKLLIRLVNHGLYMVATTHSDILVQHINNMCRVKALGSPKELLEKLGLSEEDAIDIQDVAIYQFTDLVEYSIVEKLIPEDGEFQVKTFYNALTEILEHTSEVHDYEGE